MFGIYNTLKLYFRFLYDCYSLTELTHPQNFIVQSGRMTDTTGDCEVSSVRPYDCSAGSWRLCSLSIEIKLYIEVYQHYSFVCMRKSECGELNTILCLESAISRLEVSVTIVVDSHSFLLIAQGWRINYEFKDSVITIHYICILSNCGSPKYWLKYL